MTGTDPKTDELTEIEELLRSLAPLLDELREADQEPDPATLLQRIEELLARR